MDHHCPWVANCIGHYNYKYFFNMLFYTALNTMMMVAYSYGLIERVLDKDKVDYMLSYYLVVSFFLVRIVFGPYAIYQHSYLLYTVGRTSEESKACLPTGFDHVIFIVGMFFNVLNAFWFYKILRKLQRKLNGTESVHGNNSLGNAKDGVKGPLSKAKKEQD